MKKTFFVATLSSVVLALSLLLTPSAMAHNVAKHRVIPHTCAGQQAKASASETIPNFPGGTAFVTLYGLYNQTNCVLYGFKAYAQVNANTITTGYVTAYVTTNQANNHSTAYLTSSSTEADATTTAPGTCASAKVTADINGTIKTVSTVNVCP